jgi:vitamin B12/bleomycin/antimicrobial peptide transport system ATP-binding/permease protein
LGRGQINLDERNWLFVPQRPYLPLGTLTSALLYPGIDIGEFTTRPLENVLMQVGLDGLTGELDVVENWSQKAFTGRAAAT